MAIKKSELYNHIWKACDELRGGMDASQYKDYVLTLLFVRYVSDKYGQAEDSLVEIPKGGSFADLVAFKNKPGIGEKINVALKALAEANGLVGVIDAVDFDDEDKLGKGQEMVDRLSKLVGIFETADLDFSKNRSEGDDLLGDAYEYLMKHFAVESGKSKGQFYTPAEVSRIMARVIGARRSSGNTVTVYDPTCGSGSLLLKVADEAEKGITICGQELDNATAGLAVLNMWLHGRSLSTIKKGRNTISNPFFVENGSLKTFDFVVANPPFTSKNWSTGFNPTEDSFGRFDEYGIPPEKKGDYAFLLHILKSLKSTGTGAIILPHGVLFRGDVEASIRTNIVKRGYIKGIIGLPANLFYGTGIPACVIVLDKAEAASRRGIFMIDASKGFAKDGNKNRLRERDIRKITDAWEHFEDIPKYARFVSNEEIQANDYNLNLPRYIDTHEPEDIQDIDAHLKGGIPDADIERLAAYWSICPTLKQSLFRRNGRPGYSEMLVVHEDVKATVLRHPEFAAFRAQALASFDAWRRPTEAFLKKVSSKDHPKPIIRDISETLLKQFSDLSLVDRYDLYQRLMDYWEETMQDDAYIITVDGWQAGQELVRLQKETKNKGKTSKKTIAGLAGLEGRLVPVRLAIRIYFSEEQSAIDALSAEGERLAAEMEALRDEEGGEEGSLVEVIDNDKIKKADVQRRIKEIGRMKKAKEYAEELAALKQYLALMEREAETKKSIKNAERDLEQKLLAKYPTFSESEIKTLVVEQKWLATIAERIALEIDHVSQALAGRVRELAARYETPLPEINREVSELESKVKAHLVVMGFDTAGL